MSASWYDWLKEKFKTWYDNDEVLDYDDEDNQEDIQEDDRARYYPNHFAEDNNSYQDDEDNDTSWEDVL